MIIAHSVVALGLLLLLDVVANGVILALTNDTSVIPYVSV